MAAGQRAGEIVGVGVGKEPRRGIGIIAIAENGAANGPDLKAVRALGHLYIRG
jgi:hypothetical protein